MVGLSLVDLGDGVPGDGGFVGFQLGGGIGGGGRGGVDGFREEGEEEGEGEEGMERRLIFGCLRWGLGTGEGT